MEVPAEARQWTDATGTKHAQATLIAIEGQSVRLRRPDGTIAKATIDQLSAGDQQYVLSLRNPPAEPPKSDPKPTSVVSDVADAVAKKAAELGELPKWLPANQLPLPKQITPAALIHVRVSRGFLEDYVERTVNTEKPVTDCVLGTRIVGRSQTEGKTRLVLRPSEKSARGEITFDGTVHARTTGYNGPAVLHYESDTNFRSRKTINMDGSGVHVGTATTEAPTNLQINGIDINLPGLRGRIGRRIAWRRARSSHGRAEEITADHTGARVGGDFDKRINASMAKIEEVLMSKIPELNFDRSRQEATMRFRSTGDFVELALVRNSASEEERAYRPPKVTGTPDVAIRVHRTLLSSALADPEFSKNLAPVFAKLLKARIADTASAALGSSNSSKEDPTRWSIDLDWLSLDYTDPNR